ncbi:GNAT family N-acetyltransferase [bacterium]|nr:GNAT family N-acetyltransferase [bacterium]
MIHYFASHHDVDLLAGWNEELIQDEGHRNRMSREQLRERMAEWLDGHYRAIIFMADAEPSAYAVYAETRDEIYLRQFFVRRPCRRRGIGRAAIEILRRQVWPPDKRVTLEVLSNNTAAAAFWRAVGFRDYSLTMELLPGGD